MAIVSLRPIDTRRLARAVVRLQLAPGQEEFIAPNSISMADAYVERDWMPLAVFADEELVGFAMYGHELPEDRWWIIRLMFDARFQGRGYGRAAAEALIALMRKRHGCREIFLGLEDGNQIAERLYASLGFRATGEIDDGEIVMALNLPATEADG